MITLVSLVLSEAKSPLSLSSFSFLCIKWPEQCVRVAACSIFTVKWNTCQGSNFSAIYTRTNCTPLPLCHLPLQHERRVRRLSLSALVNFAHLKRGTSRWLYQTDPWSWPFPPSTASLNTWVVHVCVERPHFQFGAAVSGFDCSFSHPLCLSFPLSHSPSFNLLLLELVGWPNNPKSSRLDYIAGTWCSSKFQLLLLLKLWFFRREMKNISSEFSLF